MTAASLLIFDEESINNMSTSTIRNAYSMNIYFTSGKRAFGLDPLVPAGTKGPTTSPQNRLADREALVPACNEPLGHLQWADHFGQLKRPNRSVWVGPQTGWATLSGWVGG
jgi:hypothetical protein